MVTLAALPLGLLGCELVVRVRGLARLPVPQQRGSVTEADPVLGHRPLAGGRQIVRFVDAPGRPVREVVARVNAQGFRGPELEPRAREGVLRIACLGDSHTFGYAVGDDETWPAALGRELEGRLGSGRFELVNAGVNGYDTEQEALWLERGVLPAEPDLVLWQYFVNDVAIRGLELREEHRPSGLHARLAPGAGGLLGWLRRHSRAVDLLAGRWHHKLELDLFTRSRTDLHAEGSPAWERTHAALLRGRDLCRANDVHLVIVLFPLLHRMDGSLASTPALERVAASCRADGIAVLDLSPVFEGREVDGLRVHPADLHFGVEAYALAARALADELAADGRWLAR